MSKIVLTRGLPASGKSTWAKAWVDADPSTRLRVNRDDIRFQLYGKYWDVDEQAVSKVEEAMVEAAVRAGRDVVIDATHLAARYITRWRKLYGNVEVMDFEVELGVLRDRDLMRHAAGSRSVGAKVINDMAQRYQIKADGKLPPLPEMPAEGNIWTPAPPVQDFLPWAIIVDIDGTLANHVGIRSPYDTSRYEYDTHFDDVATVVDSLQRDTGLKLLCVSGRDAAFREVTTDWLRRVPGIVPDKLFMRPEDDQRNDSIVKHELFHEHIAGKYNVVGVFDDRGRVLRMWRAIGLTTFAVGDTDNYNF